MRNLCVPKLILLTFRSSLQQRLHVEPYKAKGFTLPQPTYTLRRFHSHVQVFLYLDLTIANCLLRTVWSYKIRSQKYLSINFYMISRLNKAVKIVDIHTKNYINRCNRVIIFYSLSMQVII